MNKKRDKLSVKNKILISVGVIIAIVFFGGFKIADVTGQSIVNGSAGAEGFPGWGYCNSGNRCSQGNGDCDRDFDCQSGLKCVKDVGSNYYGSRFRTVDICEGATDIVNRTLVPLNTSTTADNTFGNLTALGNSTETGVLTMQQKREILDLLNKCEPNRVLINVNTDSTFNTCNNYCNNVGKTCIGGSFSLSNNSDPVVNAATQDISCNEPRNQLLQESYNLDMPAFVQCTCCAY